MVFQKNSKFFKIFFQETGVTPSARRIRVAWSTGAEISNMVLPSSLNQTIDGDSSGTVGM